MNEIEYVLRVILRARNEMGRAFATAKKQLDAFVASAKTADKDLDSFNKRINTMNTRIGNSTKKMNEWHAAIRSFTGEADKADKASAKTAKSIEEIGKGAETAAKKTKVQTQASAELHKATRELGDSFVDLTKDIQSGKRPRDDYVRDLKRIVTEYDKLEKKTKFGSEQQKSFRETGNAARTLLRDLDNLTKGEEKRSVAALKGAETKRKSKAASDAQAAAERVLAVRIADVTGEHERLNEAVRRNSITQEEHRSTAQRLANEYKKLSGAFDVGSHRARVFGTESERMRTRVASLGREARTTTTRVESLGKSFSDGDRHAKRFGGGIAQLDNNLRGLGLLAAFAASQQLLTGLIGLGGQFVAVASSAAMAGTAIGGGIVAGVAQAIPAIGLLTAAMVRVKGVMNAVNQAQLLQKQHFVAGEKASRANADGIDQITNAQDSLRDAHQRVAEAQDGVTEAQKRAADATKDVTQAQKDARRELQDMILAQKEASLAAKGAALSERDAQAALQKAIQTGGDVRRAQLDVEEARLRAQDARRQAGRQTVDTRAAVRGGVQGMPGVVAARKAAEDAEQALDKARQAAQDASEGVAKASRGLETARRNAAEAVAGTQTAQAQLDFMLSQLSPAERKLYTAITNFQKLFRTTYRGITDDIIGSFTHAVNRAAEILKMPQVLAEARKLSREIGKSFREITDAFTSQPMVEQFLRITEAGRKNLAPLTDIVINLGKAFANIAEAAGPALDRFLDFVSNLVGKFEDLTGQRGKLTDFFLEGEKHLEAWVTLGIAIINFFAALAGAGGADSGLKSVQDATKAIDGLTEKIRDNSEKVRGFFEDARKVVDDIIGVVVALGEELFNSFSPDHIHGLATFLKEAVIPALGDVMRAVSGITDLFLTIAAIPGFDDAIQLLIELSAFAFVASSVGKGFKTVGDNFKNVATMAGAARDAVQKYGSKLEEVGGAMSTRGKVIGEAVETGAETGAPVAGGTARAGRVFERLGPVATRAGKVIGTAASFAFGPWGIAIAATIAAIILLDKKFHFLEPTFKWLKGAVRDVVEFMKHNWPLVLAPLTLGLSLVVGQIVKHWGAIRGAFRSAYRFVRGIFGDISDFISGHGGGPIGRALSRVLRFIIRWSPAGVMFRVGREMAHGLWDGFKWLAHIFADIGTWLFNHVIKPIYEFFEIESPSGYFKRIGRMLIDGLVEGFNQLPHLLSNAVHKMGDALGDIGERIAKALWEGIKKGPGGVAKLVSKGVDLVLAEGGPIPGFGGGDIVPALLEPGEHVLTKDEVRRAGGHDAIFALRAILGGGGQGTGGRFQAGGAARSGGGLTIAFRGGDLDDFRSSWRAFWVALVRSAVFGTDRIQREFRQMRVATTQSADRMYRDIRGSLADIQNSFKVRGKRLSDNWSETWGDLKKLAYDGLFYIGHEANRALKGFGAKTISFGLTAPHAERKASGGFIGNKGERGRDMVPTWLGTGEAVLNWAQQGVVEPALNAYYGFGLDTMFRRYNAFHAEPTGVPGLAAGGRAGESHLSRLIAAANKVDALGLPYVWGGGHQQPAQIGHGMDCSGSVSYVVQQAGYKVPTVTSGNMPSWGFPSGGDGAVVYYNPGHTFMRVGSRFFGTSGFARPNGGAGWFNQTPSAAYLAGFKQIHLPDIKKVGQFATAIGGEIAQLMVHGPTSAFKGMFQKLFDKTVGAANEYIASKAPDISAGGGEFGDSVTTVAAGAGNIFKFFTDHGFTPEQAAGWVGNFTQESNLNPGAVQAGGPGRGLAQWGGGRFAALQNFAKSQGKDDWRNLGVQLGFVLHELSGPESAAMAAIKAARTVQQAVDAIGLKYERFGIAGNRYGPALAAFRQFGGHFAEGGIVGGGDGTPVPIVAHAGEWILNKTQQARAASLAGITPGTLKSMLGFWGGGGHFQGGGEAAPLLEGPLDKTKMKSIVDAQLRHVFVALRELTSTYAKSLRTGVVGTFTARLDRVMDSLQAASTRLSRVGRADRRRGVDRFLLVVENLTGEGGLFDRLRGAIELRAARAQRALTRARFTVGAGRVVREQEGSTAVTQAADARDEQRRLQGDLLREQAAIARELRQVRRQQRRGGLSPELRQRLATQAAALQGKLDEAEQRVADNIQAIYDAQQAYAEALIAQQQEAVDAITKKYETQTAGNEIFRRMATALGNEDWLVQINASQRDILTNQANELEARIAGARAAGATELADSLVQQVADLRAQVFESIQQDMKDAADRINRSAQRKTAALDIAGRLLDAAGVVGQTVAGAAGISRQGIFAARGAALTEQRAGLAGVLGQAQAAGNLGLIQDLTDQIAELDATIAENTKAAFQARIEDVNSRSGYALGINDLNKQIIELTGQISGNTDSVGLLALANERQAILVQKGNDLQQLYNEAVSTGDVQAQQDLMQAILENRVATLQNTQAINELNGSMTDPQTFTSSAWTQFREAIFTGMGQVLPQYDIPTAQTGGIARRTGIYKLHAGELIKPAGAWSSNSTAEGDVNITVNAVEGNVDTTAIASAVGFAKKTMQ